MSDFVFDITKPPKKGSPDVGKWAWTLYDLSRAWRDDELQMPEIWKENHRLFRGAHWRTGNRKPNNMTVNLFFSNVTRTVANITARNPVAEVVDLDGDADGLAKVATARTKKWWLDTNQPQKLRTTTANNEIYGITWEKSVWSKRDMQPGVVVCDPFAIFPYPGYWDDVALNCPAICHATALEPSVVENMYGVDGVEVSETYQLLGGEREEVIGTSSYGLTRTATPLGSASSVRNLSIKTGFRGDQALVIEVWCRDYSTTSQTDADTGETVDVPVYPGGVRCITICNEGKLVLSDEANPNLNFELPESALRENFFYHRFPFYKSNSYNDSTSIFGFSAAEQTAHINLKIDELLSRLVNYAMRAMTGILVIPPGSGVTKAMLNNKPNLVVFPQTDTAAAGIRFVPLPNPPSIIEKVLSTLIDLHDRVYAIQDADRGETPRNITAASAIVALQERNAVLIQHKIDAIDRLVEQRGNCAVAQWQMHGHTIETVEVDDGMAEFSGIRMAGRRFNYTVESGSTMPKTSLQIQEQAIQLGEKGWIDQEAVLESLNFPGWKRIVERMAEQDQLGQAVQVLIQAGMPEEQAMQLYQYLSQPQGGPGNYQQEPQPGVPRAQQGEMQ